MDLLLALPILIPLSAAAISLALWKWPAAQRALNVLAAFALLAAAIALLIAVHRDGIAASYVGGWKAPFGITLVADLFSAIMVVVTGVMGAAVTVYSLGDIGPRREAFGYHPLLQVLLMSICGAFLTGDIFNLYVWFEVMLMSSFVLLTLGGRRGQIEGAIKYVTLNLLSSGVFLAAVGILYGLMGTLNMADLAAKMPHARHGGLLTVVAMMLLVTFGVKAAVFPLFFWLPASYHTPPVAVSAIFAAMLTKVGVYALIRVFTLIFTHDVGYTHLIILVIAGLTMITGVLGAIAQHDLRRILSFHIISQIGYMITGLGLLVILARNDSPQAHTLAKLALAGSLFYIVHHIIVKTTLFLVSGIAERHSGTGQLQYQGGLYRARPWLAILFLVPALSLAGIPPFSGFWAKFFLIKAALLMGQYTIAAAALVVGLLTLFSMTKIWSETFWKPAPSEDLDEGGHTLEPITRFKTVALYLPMFALAGLTIAISIAPAALFDLANQAAEQLLNPKLYIDAVRTGAEATP